MCTEGTPPDHFSLGGSKGLVYMRVIKVGVCHPVQIRFVRVQGALCCKIVGA